MIVNYFKYYTVFLTSLTNLQMSLFKRIKIIRILFMVRTRLFNGMSNLLQNHFIRNFTQKNSTILRFNCGALLTPTTICCHREAGVGCAVSLPSTWQMDSHRTELLQLIVTCCSESLYHPPQGNDNTFLFLCSSAHVYRKILVGKI